MTLKLRTRIFYSCAALIFTAWSFDAISTLLHHRTDWLTALHPSVLVLGVICLLMAVLSARKRL